MREEVNVVKNFIERDILEALEELSSYDPALFYSDKYIDVDAKKIKSIKLKNLWLVIKYG